MTTHKILKTDLKHCRYFCLLSKTVKKKTEYIVKEENEIKLITDNKIKAEKFYNLIIETK